MLENGPVKLAAVTSAVFMWVLMYLVSCVVEVSEVYAVMFLACMQTSPIPLLQVEKRHLRNAVPNHVPVSSCSGFEFHINYGCVRAVT